MLNFYFKKSERASLPEIHAYAEYFSGQGHNVYSGFESVFEFEKNKNIKVDVVWEVKGFMGEKNYKDKLLVHDYPSLSTGIFPETKNKLKKYLNQKPDLRLFLNEDVRRDFNFTDNIPFLIRDMGIHSNFIKTYNRTEKFEYDFIYVGVVSEARGIEHLLEMFVNEKNFESYKFCLVGDYSNTIFEKFSKYSNIFFVGKVPYESVPQYIMKSRICINYIPNKYPFNIQTSTKMLEYLSMGKPVLTTNYHWVRKFEKENNIKLAKIEKTGFSVTEIENETKISNFSPENYTWDSVFEEINLNVEILKAYHRKMSKND